MTPISQDPSACACIPEANNIVLGDLFSDLRLGQIFLAVLHFIAVAARRPELQRRDGDIAQQKHFV